MKTILTYLLLAVLALLTANGAFAQTATAAAPTISPNKAKLIKELMEMSNLEKTMAEQLQNSIGLLRQAFYKGFPEAPVKEVDNMIDNHFTSSRILTKLLPLFDKYYTEADLTELIAFYKTPLGKKFLEVGPKITSESIEIGRETGISMAKEVYQGLVDKGYKPKQDAAEDQK